MILQKTIAAFAAVLFVVSTAEAKVKRKEACDGIHRCRCGTTQANYFGLPWSYKGHNLKRAIEWKHAFPRTSLREGVVVYQRGGGPSGHVSRVVRYSGTGCIATITDDAGTRLRDVCKRGAVYLDVKSSISQNLRLRSYADITLKPPDDRTAIY